MKSRVFGLFIALIIGGCFATAPSSTSANGGVQQKSGASANGSQQTSAQEAKAKQEDCACEAANTPTGTVGSVNGVKISIEDLQEAIKDEVAGFQKQVIDARGKELNLQINSRLLEAEAKKKGTTATRLIEREIMGAIKEPTDAEAQAFYDQNKNRIPGEFKDFKVRVIDYLKGQRQEQAAKAFADALRAAADVNVLVEKVTPPEKPADRAKLLATVNGASITLGDIEEALKPLVYEVQQRVYELRKSEMELKVNDILLQQVAEQRKITPRALVEAELTPTVKTITDEDAEKFYAENKANIDGDLALIKPQIVEYLQKKEQRRAEIVFADKLRKGAKIESTLKAPEPPVFQLATDDQPSKGNANAPVTIVEFTDYECSTCQQSQPVLDRLAGEYTGKVRLVVRDYPLMQHKNAFKAAEAAEAARDQGKYWEYTALLFQNQKALEGEKLKEYASKAGLDRKKFDAELDAGKHADKVQRDMQDAVRVGVKGTPTIFVNGRLVTDRTYEGLKSAIEEALKQTARKGDSL